ncbi:hypothetical protein KGA66_04455 [Actinocrinis puniceicyclus]|uniref:DUF8175 domain-containing protein n=1 Tax=Actinocrinis puniceicyclus TaxID=977794 RepID=A0A8J7WK06_9ACTN|nr:hypothetical protein [Actinocrinis puniceicyclus]MBS2962285.1 hypothetical protein [Actinocrinis puniceicyclus]
MDTAQSTPEARTRVKLPPDPYRDDEPRPGRARRPLILLVALAALVTVITIVNRSTHQSGGPAAAGQSAPSAGSSDTNAAAGATGPVATPFQNSGLPANTADGVPIGYPHTAKGAESAAANYVVAYSSSEMVTPSARHRLIDAIADPAIASSLQSQLDTAYTQVASSLGLSADGVAPAGQTFVQRSAPVGVTLVNSSGQSATVSVWAVTIAGLAGAGSTHPVAEDWSTITVTLHWTGGDWKWVSFSAADGPVPAGGQQTVSGSKDLQKAVSQFGGLRYAR